MGTKVHKLKELEYNELATIQVIEKDEDLTSIFRDEVKMSFNMLRTLSKENKLSDETKNIIKELFDKIILTKTNLINNYAQIIAIEGGEVKVIKPFEETKPVEVRKPQVPITPVKPKKENALPRRYGKANIQKDIEKQGGKPTTAQLTALEINDLKNIYVNLNGRLIKEMLTDIPVYTDEDYREIRSSITIMKNRLKPILKKK